MMVYVIDPSLIGTDHWPKLVARVFVNDQYPVLASTPQVKSVFLHNLIGSSITEYPALFTSEQNKMASSFVYVTDEQLLFQ